MHDSIDKDSTKAYDNAKERDREGSTVSKDEVASLVLINIVSRCDVDGRAVIVGSRRCLETGPSVHFFLTHKNRSLLKRLNV